MSKVKYISEAWQGGQSRSDWDRVIGGRMGGCLIGYCGGCGLVRVGEGGSGGRTTDDR
jgi:hypothetical protein